MNQKQIKDAAKKYADTNEDELAFTLKADGFSPEDSATIMDAIDAAKAKAPKAAAKEGVEEIENKNEGLDLEGFDYNNLSGDDFKKYENLIKSLDWNSLYDFELYKAVPVKEARYPGMEGTPFDVVGIKLISTTPIAKSRITAKAVTNLNAQLPNGTPSVPCFYYLLKK